MSGYCDECGNTLCICHLPEARFGPSPAERAVIDAARDALDNWAVAPPWNGISRSYNSREQLRAALNALDAASTPDEANEAET